MRHCDICNWGSRVPKGMQHPGFQALPESEGFIGCGCSSQVKFAIFSLGRCGTLQGSPVVPTRASSNQVPVIAFAHDLPCSRKFDLQATPLTHTRPDGVRLHRYEILSVTCRSHGMKLHATSRIYCQWEDPGLAVSDSSQSTGPEIAALLIHLLKTPVVGSSRQQFNGRWCLSICQTSPIDVQNLFGTMHVAEPAA